jgi:hypothetical protein
MATAPALPPEVIAYQQAHIHENLGPTVIAVASVLLCLDVTAVAARFYARRALKISYGWDDWLIIPGLVCSALCKGWGKDLTSSLGNDCVHAG